MQTLVRFRMAHRHQLVGRLPSLRAPPSERSRREATTQITHADLTGGSNHECF
jgi:hypothetical protein